MLIGFVFSYHVQRQTTAATAVLSIVALAVLFSACWKFSWMTEQFPTVAINYGYGLALFAYAYLCRDRFGPVWALDALAAISFPLYVIHSLIGYSLLKFPTMQWGLDYLPSLGLTLATLLLLAPALHVTVERWSIAMGRRNASTGTRPTPPYPHPIRDLGDVRR